MEKFLSGSCLIHNWDFGGDIMPLDTNGKVVLNAIDCARSCMGAEGCIAFTFWHDDGICWLKSSVTGKVHVGSGWPGILVASSAYVRNCWKDPLRKQNFDGKITANTEV